MVNISPITIVYKKGKDDDTFYYNTEMIEGFPDKIRIAPKWVEKNKDELCIENGIAKQTLTRLWNTKYSNYYVGDKLEGYNVKGNEPGTKVTSLLIVKQGKRAIELTYFKYLTLGIAGKQRYANNYIRNNKKKKGSN